MPVRIALVTVVATAPTRHRASIPRRARVASSNNCSSDRSSSGQSSAREAPAGVRITPRAERSRSGTPTACSNSLSCRDTLGCATPSCSAARPMLLAPATASNARRCRISTISGTLPLLLRRVEPALEYCFGIAVLRQDQRQIAQSAHGHSAIPSERVRSGYESLIGRFLPQRRDDNGGTTRCRGRAEPEVDAAAVQLFEQLRLIEVLQYQRDLRMV